MHVLSKCLLFTSAELAFAILSLLLLHSAEFEIFSCGHKIGASDGSRSLLLLDNALLGRDVGSSLHSLELAEFAQTLLLAVGLEKLSIKLVFEVEATLAWAETFRLKVEV